MADLARLEAGGASGGNPSMPGGQPMMPNPSMDMNMMGGGGMPPSMPGMTATGMGGMPPGPG